MVSSTRKTKKTKSNGSKKTNGTAKPNGYASRDGLQRCNGSHSESRINGHKHPVILQVMPVVYAIDGDSDTRQKLCELTETMNLGCETFDSAQDFLDRYDPARSGCVVTELKLPDLSGRQLQQQLRFQGCTSPVIFLTAHPDVSLAVQAMRDGAVHFLEKPFRTHDLWNAIEEAIQQDRRQREIEQELHELQQRTAELNEREYRVLQLLGQGKSNRDIARMMDVCVRTIELHRAHLMKKLNVESLVDAIEIGLLLNCLGERAMPRSNGQATARA
jgi:two-component system response regulator TtrR